MSWGAFETQGQVCQVYWDEVRVERRTCSQQLSQVSSVVVGERLLIVADKQVYWMDATTLRARAVGRAKAIGAPSWSTDGRIRYLAPDPSQMIGDLVRSCTLDGLCDERPLGIKAYQPAWQGDTLAFVGLDGVYTLDLLDLSAKPVNRGSAGEGVSHLAFREGVLWAVGTDSVLRVDEAGTETLSWDSPGLPWVLRDGFVPEPEVWWGRPVEVSLVNGRRVVRDAAGVLIRMPGDIARVW